MPGPDIGRPDFPAGKSGRFGFAMPVVLRTGSLCLRPVFCRLPKRRRMEKMKFFS